MNKGFVLREVGTAVMYINYTNVSLQRFNVINSEWPNMPCHFWIQVGDQVGSCIWDQHGLAAKFWSQLTAGAVPRINIFPRLHQHMSHLLPTSDATFQ